MLGRFVNLDAQYRRPSGWLGRYIGHDMARDHQPENRWTLDVLHARPSDQILEIGFGPGVAIQALSTIVSTGQIIGVDFSPTMLRAARRRNAAAIRAGRVRLLGGEANNLPLVGERFDQAFSIHSIYFWPQASAALAEIWRVLRPGGRLVLTILPRERWNSDNPDLPVGTPECRPYTGAELQTMLHVAGFSATSIVADSNPAHRSNYCVVASKDVATSNS
ncbi:class I SAM-dependent methyltransferase [Herpetosiphon sp. NSE202]|uniref:class I SAM-dependent methyltransferase n=1 Tax=Herpetosiphon sp. NSE202 TaxID=3351349 RepID=UPI003644A983